VIVQGHEHPWLLVERACKQMTQAGRQARHPTAGHYAAKSRYRQADSDCDLSAGRDRRVSARFWRKPSMGRDARSIGRLCMTARWCLGGGVIAQVG